MRLRELQYIVHVKNLKEVLTRGIYSHNEVERLKLKPEMISNPDVMELRRQKKVEGEKTLWDYANLYFKARNPMLWNIITNYGVENVVVLGLKPNVTGLPGVKITNGNAASFSTDIFPKSQLKEVLESIKEEIDSDWWTAVGDSKRKIMAETLVPQKIPPEYITSIYVANDKVKKKVESLLGDEVNKESIIKEPSLFFQGEIKNIIGNISIIEGDMFFSKMQTLTISVNTVGIMGKGLASRAKYQFPDVFVYYQDICKRGELKMGVPVLYKRESSINDILSVDYIDNKEPTWFLLFPTKNHWRFDSDPVGIEKGLLWFKDNYESLGIKSIALPALGCGLGNLSWAQIGPMMVKHLKGLKIPVQIYLPTEKDIPTEQISTQFLLKQ
ncbi:DarT ssDNA thymidine ADP-ribosyltransferase family protein [Candidatus Pacearchaeota archaeon]|nr:DarT ssDNA thymidine ADP-ribosyltransferase family protein [Candidatus Pacearchaeota archaeon]